MSKEQKGFIVYKDIEPVIDVLTDEQTGQLFKGMVKYFSDGVEPSLDGVLSFVFIPIKQQMDRDAEKYEARCSKNRENIKAYWSSKKGENADVGNVENSESDKENTNEYNRKQMYSIATNKNTNTNTKTNKNTNTKTTTTTKTKTNNCGGGGCDDDFNIWHQLDPDGIDSIYDVYPKSGGYLIDEVAKDVREKKKKVKNAVNYILGYAKKVKWDDAADHFEYEM